MSLLGDMPGHMSSLESVKPYKQTRIARGVRLPQTSDVRKLSLSMRRLLLAGVCGILLAVIAVAAESWRRSSSHSSAEALCQSVAGGASRSEVTARANREPATVSVQAVGDDMRIHVAGGCFCRVRFSADAVTSVLAICNN